MTGSAVGAHGATAERRPEADSRSGDLPAQRASTVASAVASLGRPGESGDASQAGGVLLMDTDQAALMSLNDELVTVGLGPVRVATNIDDIEDIARQQSRLAVVSLRFGSRAIAAIRALRLGGWRRVLALATTAEPEPAIDAMAAGATGVVVARRANPTSGQLPAGVHDLSAREVEVIRMVADGRSNKWIGEQLDLSALTVKSHLARIGRKLGTGDRAHIVALALRAGVIT